MPSTAALLKGLLCRDRACLSRAITLVESTRREHREEAQLLLDALLAARPPPPPAAAPSTFRVGVAGPPGAGKSTFIEALGLHILREEAGAAAAPSGVAVVAVDPSSPRTGGSILGDKTRMGALCAAEGAFVRPSPARGNLGGVARATHEVVALCEGAGFGTVLVETVGLGQSEVAVDGCVDALLLVLPPAGGDELQGLKKGIVEVADVVVVNKADGALRHAAEVAAGEYRNAVALNTWKHGAAWRPRVLTASAAEGRGVAEAWGALSELRAALGAAGALRERRRAQAEGFMWADFRAELVARAEAQRGVAAVARAQGPLLADGLRTPRAAARALMHALDAAWGGAAPSRD
jgi:LAO/AO transport system kinase